MPKVRVKSFDAFRTRKRLRCNGDGTTCFTHEKDDA